MAVGIGLRTDMISSFFEILNKEVQKAIVSEDLVQHLAYDGEMGLGELNRELFEYFDKLGPFGHSNPKPVFRFNGLEIVRSQAIGNGHVRGTFRSYGQQVDFIAFNRSIDEFPYQQAVDVLATPQLNTRFNDSIQLNICAVMPSEYF
jgi:single-stranded-DNA-specific exonuclease